MALVPLGEWLPDQPPLNHPGLLTARNAIPTVLGYRPLSKLVALGLQTLDARCRGMISALDLTGQSTNFAGDGTKLYRFTSAGRVDVSPVNPPDTVIGALPAAGQWDFAQHFDRVIAVSPGNIPYSYQIGVDSTFKDLTGAPQAEHVAVIKQFTVLGNLNTDVSAIHWSAFNNPTSWPTVGTNAARQVQSDSQPLAGAGGAIQKILGVGDLGMIFQERTVWRMGFVGGDVVFDLSPADTFHGALMSGGVVSDGNTVYFWSEDGFRATNGGPSIPIGAEKIDRTTLADLDTAFLDRVSSVADPESPLVVWLYPGAGNTAGLPNRMLIYHKTLNRWARAEIEAEFVGLVGPIGESFDSQNIANLDSPSIAMDVISGASSGPNQLGGYDSAHSISTFSGMALAARFETGDREIARELFGRQGRTSLVRGIRPLVDGGTSEVRVASRPTPQATATFGPAVRPNSIGKCDFRVRGRYHRARLDILEGGFTEAQALDLDAIVKGRR